MRKILFAILLVVLVFPVKGIKHEIYSEVYSSDEGIHVYFTNVLKDVEKSLDKFLEEDLDVLDYAMKVERIVKLTAEENRFYAAKGIKSNVSVVLPPFLSISKAVKNLAKNQLVFLDSIVNINKSYVSYIKARIAVINMKSSANEINKSISKIEKLELWNGTSKIHFDVSELKSKLEEVYDLIAYYETLLLNFEIKKGFEGLIVVAVSEDHPYLYQEVTITVYTINVKPRYLFIDNIKYELTNNITIKKYTFKELGEHTIYAVGIKNEKIVRSNVVKVYVSKIPTSITLSAKSKAFINERVKVVGFLFDHYGNPLKAIIRVKVDGKEFELLTHSGFFEFNVTKSSEGPLKVSTFYFGNDTYKGSNASMSIYFSRIPTRLYIEASKMYVNVNESVDFKGKVYGVGYAVPVQIFLNNTKIKTINTAREFNFSLIFSKPKKYSVFVYFPGNSMYQPAKSNVVEITVANQFLVNPLTNQTLISSKMEQKGLNKELKGVLLFLLILSVFALLPTYKYFRKRKRKKKVKIEKEKKKEELRELKEIRKEEIVEKRDILSKPEIHIKLPENIKEAYKILFNNLVTKYNLKRSLTPRELLQNLHSEYFAEELSIVTKLHEKAVYAKIELNTHEREIYFKSILEILEGLK